jgi:hypothetical protein
LYCIPCPYIDDDQGEKLILAVIVDSSKSHVRPVRIEPHSKKVEAWNDGDEDIELLLQPSKDESASSGAG